MKRSPLHEDHKARNGRFIGFGGWEMPVQFQGILAEHKAVREKAGVFDISHMGQVWVLGKDAQSYLNELLTNDVTQLSPGQGQYTLMCREDGGVVDDLYVFCFEIDRYFLIVNAARREVDFQWMYDQKKGSVGISEEKEAAAIALQGPESETILKKLITEPAALPRNGIGEYLFEGQKIIISRTGYTGEDGFEIFGPIQNIQTFSKALHNKGESNGLVPCGLGCRDTLRLEMGYRLYGQDMDEQHNGYEAGLGWVIKLNKTNFTGKQSLEREKTKGLKQRIGAFTLKGAGVARHGYPLFSGDQQVGEVTSGTFSPSLQKSIGLGYIESSIYSSWEKKELSLNVKVHGRLVPIEKAKLPFYQAKTKATI